MRSPLAYPLNRSADADVGGAADLQTDVMRFMAILSLCLVAIFALVQSLPMTPQELAVEDAATKSVTPDTAAPSSASAPPPQTEDPEAAVIEDTPQPAAKIVLQRPKWTSTFTPRVAQQVPAEPVPPDSSTTAAPSTKVNEAAQVAVSSEPGFTLRFESDAALARLVASQQVGLYAIHQSSARRMAMKNSRVSFWDASMPKRYHEMEPATVPAFVTDALQSNNTPENAVRWGVTLPGTLRGQLDQLMQSHSGGTLIIEAGGTIRREPVQ